MACCTKRHQLSPCCRQVWRIVRKRSHHCWPFCPRVPWVIRRSITQKLLSALGDIVGRLDIGAGDKRPSPLSVQLWVPDLTGGNQPPGTTCLQTGTWMIAIRCPSAVCRSSGLAARQWALRTGRYWLRFLRRPGIRVWAACGREPAHMRIRPCGLAPGY